MGLHLEVWGLWGGTWYRGHGWRLHLVQGGRALGLHLAWRVWVAPGTGKCVGGVLRLVEVGFEGCTYYGRQGLGRRALSDRGRVGGVEGRGSYPSFLPGKPGFSTTLRLGNWDLFLVLRSLCLSFPSSQGLSHTVPRAGSIDMSLKAPCIPLPEFPGTENQGQGILDWPP